MVNAQYAAFRLCRWQRWTSLLQSAGWTPEQAAHLTHPTARRGTYRGNYGGAQSIRISENASDPRSIGFCAAHPGYDQLARCANPNWQQLFAHF